MSVEDYQELEHRRLAVQCAEHLDALREAHPDMWDRIQERKQDCSDGTEARASIFASRLRQDSIAAAGVLSTGYMT